jgi:DNA sulfur modification protein DndB
MIPNSLAIPAIRAQMGDWIYYIAQMPMDEIATRVALISEVYQSTTLSDLIQRTLTPNANSIAEYLRNQPQRFFNALVLGSFGGAPQWMELSVPDLLSNQQLPEHLAGRLGFLLFDGTESMFPIDGQHRVAGIRQAVNADDHLGAEDVAVIVVGHDVATAEGLARTRRLFTTLNRYAKPISKTDAIALDEDDVVAIITRQLIETDPLWRDKTSITLTRAMPVSDTANFSHLLTLYGSLDKFLRDKPASAWGRFKRHRPSDDVIEQYQRRATRLWQGLANAIEPLRVTRDAPPGPRLAAPYRSRAGGSLVFRPIGLEIIVDVVAWLVAEGQTIEEATAATARAPLALQELPWLNLLWDQINHRMITTKENREAAALLLYYGLGGQLANRRKTPDALRIELGGLMNVPPRRVILARF